MNAIKYATDHLPAGELRDLAKDMANSSIDSNERIHAHFDDEMTKLTQLEIPESEALQLVSEQFGLVIDQLFECRQEVLDYTILGCCA